MNHFPITGWNWAGPVRPAPAQKPFHVPHFLLVKGFGLLDVTYIPKSRFEQSRTKEGEHAEREGKQTGRNSTEIRQSPSPPSRDTYTQSDAICESLCWSEGPCPGGGWWLPRLSTSTWPQKPGTSRLTTEISANHRPVTSSPTDQRNRASPWSPPLPFSFKNCSKTPLGTLGL